MILLQTAKARYFVHLRRNVIHFADLFIEVDRHIRMSDAATDSTPLNRTTDGVLP